ncbi:MAG TPA: 2-C-methyl-D-erythritol 2,4-cyclodiphosphate synthase [Blastocatellia bacterium]|nr:2-C-methyl-D-erythritol 2,4-cyclodiphosphate synthase [Blastocatellia bacterium]
MKTQTRVGIGYDIHRLAPNRPLIIGGVEIPFERGLAGHSDADVLSHALCDALLGAVCLGDIGRHFPDDDPQFEGISSLKMLAWVADLIQSLGYVIGNIDSVILAERPKMSAHIPAMQQKLAATLKISSGQIAIKAKTNEGLDAVGRGEAIAAHAVAIILPASPDDGPEPRAKDAGL